MNQSAPLLKFGTETLPVTRSQYIFYRYKKKRASNIHRQITMSIWSIIMSDVQDIMTAKEPHRSMGLCASSSFSIHTLQLTIFIYS